MDVMSAATVFGLDVWSDESLPCLRGASAASTGRVLDILIDRRDGVGDWPPDARLISAQHEPDGTFAVRIEAHREAGYRLSGPRYGRHVLSSDGRRLRCYPDGAEAADWQRFLIGQVLPFAAALNKLEVLHAGAVALCGRALALLGASGAGKTSLALALCRSGAEFMADDVLALERREGALLAHPGTPAAGVAHCEAGRLGSRLGAGAVLAVNERERLIRVSPRRDPAVLGGLLFLQRRADGPSEPLIERCADTQLLLASTFNFVLHDPERLERLLDVCAVASRGAVARVSFGPACDADRLAIAVAGWFESLR
jgi:hypothetical protein